jgi:hypothetical protein
MKLQRNLHCKKLEGNMTICALITFTEVPLKTWANPRRGRDQDQKKKTKYQPYTNHIRKNPVGDEEK